MAILKEKTSKKRAIVFLSVAALVIAAPFAVRMLTHQTVKLSGSAAYQSIDDLFAGSSLVAAGTITEENGSIRVRHAAADGEANFTDYTFQINHVIQGQPASSAVTVRIRGGTAGNVTEIYRQDPNFSVNQEYLLFLYQPGMGGGFNTEGDYYYVRGADQGVFTKDGNGTYVTANGVTLPTNRLVSAGNVRPVNESSARNEYISNQQLNLSNGFITEEEYHALLSEMDQYAVIVDRSDN